MNGMVGSRGRRRPLDKLPVAYRDAIPDWIDDMELQNWPENPTFELRRVPLKDLEKARLRPLELSGIDKSMAGETRTRGPIMLDVDLSVIDGMHRLADAWSIGKRHIAAWVCIRDLG